MSGQRYRTPYSLAVLTLLAILAAPHPAAAEKERKEIAHHRSTKMKHSNSGVHYRLVTARKGDTVYTLGNKYGVSARAIIEANQMKPIYALDPGKKVKIPSVHLHKVQAGENIYTISRTEGVDMYSIVKENKLQKPYVLMQGQKLRIPFSNYAGQKPEKIPASILMGNSFTALPTARPVEEVPQDIPRNSPPVRRVDIEKAISGLGDNAVRSFAWPVKGRVISRFGAQKGGVYNDGVNIAAPEGEAVHAAADGVVMYVGDELKDYGNLVLVRHSGGWITAYAHQQKIAVQRGDKVRKSQVIGYVGSSGTVKNPQIHFAIRKGRQAVDPMRYLRG